MSIRAVTPTTATGAPSHPDKQEAIGGTRGGRSYAQGQSGAECGAADETERLGTVRGLQRGKHGGCMNSRDGEGTMNYPAIEPLLD